MDLLGTKRLVGIVEDALGTTLPVTELTLAKLGEALDQSGIFLSEATDLVQDVDRIAEAFPEQWQSLVQAVLGLANHLVRVGTQASLTAQDARKTLADLRETNTVARSLLAAIHAKGLRVMIAE